MNLGGKKFTGPLSLDSDEAPSARAVYCITIGEEPVYVGRAENLRARMRQQRSNPVFAGAEPPPELFYWSPGEGELFEARALEAMLISSLRPRFNRVVPPPQVTEAKRQAEAASRYSTLVAGVASSIAIALMASMLFGVFRDGKPDSTVSLEQRLQKLEAMNADQAKALASVAQAMKPLQAAIESGGLKPDSIAGAQEVVRASAELKLVSARISGLEAALNTDPAKALAVPLLRKDLDNTRESLKSNIDQTKAEIDRIYDQNKWFIGLMFTIALSVLGMAASNFLSRRASQASSGE